jgi:hypothetical protein
LQSSLAVSEYKDIHIEHLNRAPISVNFNASSWIIVAFERDGVGGLSFVLWGLAEEEELLLLLLLWCFEISSKGTALGSISRDLLQLLFGQSVVLGCFATRQLPNGVSVGVCEGDLYWFNEGCPAPGISIGGDIKNC